MADDSKKSPLDIDAADLWEEWRGQHHLTRKAGHMKADAKHALAQGRAKLKVVAARLRLDIRKNPEKHGLQKITEDSVDSALEVHDDYQAAQEALRRLEYDEDICTANVAAMIDRRKGLENLVQLLSIEYHGEREPKPLSGAAAEKLKDQDRKRLRTVSRNKEQERNDSDD